MPVPPRNHAACSVHLFSLSETALSPVHCPSHTSSSPMWPLSWWLISPLGKWKWSSENFFMLKPTPSTPDSVPLMVARAAPSPVLREPISHLHARLPSFISSRESSESLDDMFPCSFYCLCLGSTSQENFQKVLFLSPISLLAFALVLIKKRKKRKI